MDKKQLLRCLDGLREEASACRRVAVQYNTGDAVAANWMGYADGIERCLEILTSEGTDPFPEDGMPRCDFTQPLSAQWQGHSEGLVWGLQELRAAGLIHPEVAAILQKQESE